MDPLCAYGPSLCHLLGSRSEPSSIDSPESLSKYNVRLWECIERRAGDHGGHILSYQVRRNVFSSCLFHDDTFFSFQNGAFFPNMEPFPSDVFNKLSIKACYPSIEPSPQEAFELLCDEKSADHAPEPMKSLLKQMISYLYKPDETRQAFRTLGFYTYIGEDQSYILEIPDNKALLGGWEYLKQSDSLLPDLKVASSERTPKNMEYISMVLENGLLASEGRECLHDMVTHVLSTIRLIFSEKNRELRAQRYEREKERFSGIVRPIFQTLAQVREKLSQNEPPPYGFSLNELEKVETSLYLFVDGWLSTSKYEGKNSREDHWIQSNWGEADQRYMWASPAIRYFWKRRFPNEPYNLASINRVQEVWQEVYRLSTTNFNPP